MKQWKYFSLIVVAQQGNDYLYWMDGKVSPGLQKDKEFPRGKTRVLVGYVKKEDSERRNSLRKIMEM